MSSQHRRQRQATAALAASALAFSGSLALLATGTSSASSHREAPLITNDPQADNTDTYAFVSPDKPGSVTLIANWIPFEEPAGGPNFYPFSPDASYNIKVDTDGDAKPDMTYTWKFHNKDRRGDVNHGDQAGGTFLYNDGPVNSISDRTLLFKQTYTLYHATARRSEQARSPPRASAGRRCPTTPPCATRRSPRSAT